MSLAPSDLKDAGFVDAEELGSDGTAEHASGSVTSVVSGVVTVSGLSLYDPATAPAENDIVVISGNTGADGSYTLNAVTADNAFTVKEPIGDGTGGTVSIRYPSGALSVGVDPTNITFSTATDLQQMLEDIAAEISGGGITEAQHKALRQLIHFLADGGPGEGITANNPVKKTSWNGIFSTGYIWYDDDPDSEPSAGKIVEKAVVWSGIMKDSETWIVYKTDGTSKAADAVDTITNSGITETKRTRVITVYP